MPWRFIWDSIAKHQALFLWSSSVIKHCIMHKTKRYQIKQIPYLLCYILFVKIKASRSTFLSFSKQRTRFHVISTLRPRQNRRHFADDILKCIFLIENVWIPIEISLKFVPKSPTNNIPALVQLMAWRRPGDKPLSEPMIVRLPTQICVTRPQWVKAGALFIKW